MSPVSALCFRIRLYQKLFEVSVALCYEPRVLILSMVVVAGNSFCCLDTLLLEGNCISLLPLCNATSQIWAPC